MMNVKTSSISAAIALALAASSGFASDLIAYEGFDYGSTPNLQFANGGVGWSTQWFKLSPIPTGVAGASLEFGALNVSGSSAITAPYPSADYTRYSRGLPAYSAPDDTVYISFLFMPNIGHGVGGGLAFGTWDNGMVLGVAPGSGFYGLAEPNGASSSASAVPMIQGETVLVVAKVHSGGDGTMTWTAAFNPDLLAPEPGTFDSELTIPGSALPQAIFLYNDGGFLTDEIRVGLTWASVLPGGTTFCAADFDADGFVGGADLAVLLGGWGSAGAGDLDGSGLVDGADLAMLLGQWGSCPTS